ncbi:MAG: hypothetical protein M1819_000709 [Sarea resinae]|nr:MAG: hypothetical protein M1819_000709 [Sarea resinae]
MVKPLTFKGDKPAKKRKRAAASTYGDGHDDNHHDDDRPSKASKETTALISTSQHKTTDTTADDDSWVSADTPTDITGPIILVLPTTPPTALASDANGSIFASALENIIDGDPATAEPHDVRQVWRVAAIAGTEGRSLKGHHGRYLGSDKFGILSATREAVSAEESFGFIPAPGQPGLFGIQTARETFLTVSGGSGDGAKAAAELRGDAETISFTSAVRVRMQARFKPRLKASREEKAREKISRKELEEVVGRRLSDEEVRRLKRARREGDYHEVILDVRVKGKHDKFASS